MLASFNRLTAKSDYLRVKEKGRLFQGRLFGFLLYERKDKDPSRFGFIVSTKISKDAVRRNRAKRVLRESVRQNMASVKSGFDCLFLAKRSLLNKRTTEVLKEVARVFREAEILNVKTTCN